MTKNIDKFVTDRPEIKEKAVIAYNQNYAALGEVGELLLHLNFQLIRCGDLLRRLQPKKPGSVTIEYNTCSSDPSKWCGGCPHPKWRTWERPVNKRLTLDFIPKPTKRPKGTLRKDGEFSDTYLQCREIVEIAQETIKVRDKMVEELKKLKTLKTRNEHVLSLLDFV